MESVAAPAAGPFAGEPLERRDPAAGVLSLATLNCDAAAPAGTPVDLARITFRVIVPSRALTSLGLGSPQLLDPGGAALPVETASQPLSLSGSADVDCDGDLTAADSLGVLRYVVSLPFNPPAGCPPIGEEG